jgi:4-hydroxyacetophenone monooxygenase
VRALISAVGMLNRPSVPDLPGLSDFAGPLVPLVALEPPRSRSRAAASA